MNTKEQLNRIGCLVLSAGLDGPIAQELYAIAREQEAELARLREGIEILIRMNCVVGDDKWIKVHTGHLNALLEGANE